MASEIHAACSQTRVRVSRAPASICTAPVWGAAVCGTRATHARAHNQLLDTIEELEEEAFLRGVPEHEIVIAKTATWGEKTPNNDPNDPDAGGRYVAI